MLTIAEVSDTQSVRIGVLFAILFVSLFASSFPSLSRRASSSSKFRIHIHPLVFFIGKHFGTGVILSTAFVHLLQDAFVSLLDPAVLELWPGGKKWGGLLVLGSLLLIFLVEYISTAFVERLHSHHHAQADPHASHSHSHTHTTDLPLNFDPDSSQRSSLLPRTHSFHYGSTTPSNPTTAAASRHIEHEERLAAAISTSGSGKDGCNADVDVDATPYFAGHHRHELRGSHASHHARSPRAQVQPVGIEDEFEYDVEDVRRSESRHGNGHGHAHGLEGTDDTHSWSGEIEIGMDEAAALGDAEDDIGRKRQVVGILVLQTGIMLHSLVIGLTLSIASGPEFTSLVAAIMFHQLFEGLSLGIRIAALPSSRSKTSGISESRMALLKPTLAVLFAVTTPLGILAGLLLLSRSDNQSPQMKLTQGLMSAISAGMLIYASCIEMLAADFVMDPQLWRSPIVRRQALALAGLLAGVAGMSIIGI